MFELTNSASLATTRDNLSHEGCTVAKLRDDPDNCGPTWGLPPKKKQVNYGHQSQQRHLLDGSLCDGTTVLSCRWFYIQHSLRRRYDAIHMSKASSRANSVSCSTLSVQSIMPTHACIYSSTWDRTAHLCTTRPIGKASYRILFGPRRGGGC